MAKKKVVVFDLESNGLVKEGTVVHTLCIYDRLSKQFLRYDQDHRPIEEGIALLDAADKLVGHNIIGFDLPFLRKIYGFEYREKEILDTQVASELFWSNVSGTDFALVRSGDMPGGLLGTHKLEAWGYRLGEFKGDYGQQENAWDVYTPDMSNYCEQDVRVTNKLYNKILKYIKHNPHEITALDVEHKFRTIIARQEKVGVGFDYDKAKRLLAFLQPILDKNIAAVRKYFPPKFFPDGKPDTFKRTSLCNIMVRIDGEQVKKKISLQIEGASKQKIKLKDFNPGSGDHIHKWLTESYGWVPVNFTDKGGVETTSEVLLKLDYPGIKELLACQMIAKRISTLKTGKAALLKNAVFEEDGSSRIYGRVKTLGAVTRRCTHSSPNLAQVPSNGSPYGKYFRDLFIPKEGYSIVGADASGLELRVLAHYVYEYDKGSLADLILDGDIHTHNQKAAGLPTRALAKTFIYAFLYGCGDTLLGEIVNPAGTEKEQARIGKKLRKQFLENMPALDKLIKKIKNRVKEHKTVIDLDGHILTARSEHSALNLLGQSCGAIIMKYWSIIADRNLMAAGFTNSYDSEDYDYEFVLNIHDEAQSEVKDDKAQAYARILEESFLETGKFLKLSIPIEGEAQVGTSWRYTH